MRDSEFDWMGAFGYSDQEGAGAFSEEKKLPEREIERRRKHLMGIQRKISKRKKKALVGKEFDLVLEGVSDETDLLLEGRTPCTRRKLTARCSSTTFLKALEPKTGEFYRCQITEAHDYDLVARIVKDHVGSPMARKRSS